MRDKFIETPKSKAYFSDDFKYVFDKQSGRTVTWGRTYEDDPDVAPFNLILDFEITERCEGIGNHGPCPFCCPAGTKILVEENGNHTTKPIEDIKVGDIVVTITNGRRVMNEVQEVYEREFYEDFVKIETKCGKSLYLTWNHKVMTRDRGWIKAVDLVCADTLIDERNEDIFINNLSYGNGNVIFPSEYEWNGRVYNFHCTPDETYIAEGILVHNCYKANTPHKGKVTSFDEAKRVIDKLPKQCTQIAFGTDAKLKSNPEWYEIFAYARECGFVPNVTVADLDDETAKKVASVCGATAVSRYHDKDICYDTVKRLTDAGMSQVNIHALISRETLPTVYETIEDIKTDKRLKKLNAIVFLSLKRKGRGENFHSISQEEFSALVMKCRELGVNFGFDSCSCHKYLNTIKGTDMEGMSVYAEPCESSCMSAYINAHGEYFPCSFTEGTKGWETGISVLDCKDFVEDVWFNPRTHNFRELLLMNDRHCPIYNV